MTDESVLDIGAVLERLPHRFPFLLVDRVLSVQAGESIVALKNVTFNEAHFAGHFPAYPVMPGVLVIEALAQAGGVLAWETAKEEPDMSKILYLAGIEKARFKRPVHPGDQLMLKAELVSRRQMLWRFESRAEVEGKLVAQAELLLATGKVG
jgi:3-hydroxyacyl-[acyl-carrier-protein] dehydratase